MKIFHSGDWHIGNFKGPEREGVNLRSLDTKRCLEFMVERAKRERPELVLVPGDIFHIGKTWSDRCCDEVVTAIEIITRLAAASGHVVIMKGTPNHDGEGQFKVLEAHFSSFHNVHIVINPEVIQTEYADIAVLPGFDRGVYRAKSHGLGKEEENEVFSQELGKIVMGLRTHCRGDRPAVLMAHYTVPGCNTESGQSQLLTQFEPIIPPEALSAADFNLVALGHIHRPQLVAGFDNVYYSGSINANNFNDEGQERGFWIHHTEQGAFGREGMVFTDSEFVKTPYREFITFRFTDTDITAIIYGHVDEVAMNYWRWNGAVANKIVRILYECSAEKKKAFNENIVANVLYEDGAFWVAGVTPERIEASADRTDLSRETDPEVNLKAYLEEKGMEPEEIERLILKARPIIAEAMAAETGAAFSGMFVPIEIEVKNYRAYAEEKFSFEDIQFCTINGQNGAGKSSLFMDAIIDCIYEEPREGKSTSVKVPWLRNDEGVRSGYISFTFSIGGKVYRVTRTRAKSGKGTLNLAELVAGEWEDRSQEKSNDTQTDIERLIGVDSMTFKSCALIMQDQYGLFLQAKKEERMVILSNLLGLGIYNSMEALAKDQSADYNRRINGKKQTIKVQSDNILAFGKPDEELAEAREDLRGVEGSVQIKKLELQNANLHLGTMRAAEERYHAIMVDISSLENKKRIAESGKTAEDATVQTCDVSLAEERVILENARKYRSLVEQEKGLIEGAAVYEARSAELDRINGQISEAEKVIADYRQTLTEYQIRLKSTESQEDQEEIKSKAAEYQEKKKLLDSMYALSRKAADLQDKRSRCAWALDSKKAYFNEQERALLAEKNSLNKRMELLDNSGCIDMEKASCRFLADALQAKAELALYPEKLKTLAEERTKALESLEKDVEAAEAEIRELNFSEEKLDALRGECGSLEIYTEKLRELERQESQIALIKARIEGIQLNIGNTEKNLSELKSRALEAELEKGKYAESYLEHEKIRNQMEGLKIWIQKENEIPVIREKRGNAERRAKELSEEIRLLEAELKEKCEQAEKAKKAAVGVVEAEQQVKDIQMEIASFEQRAKEIQVKIGGFEQRIHEIQRMKQSIAVIQAEIADMAGDAADYETLKISFSQDGIPHQIIRTILPKLSNVANNILGQMTGGQLGVDFVTEKILKSNNKKEVVTLDIFIEEYGKSSLPYLSKSGGEKVKSSLSVILALAEIKATTAGVQFGMLFIDEPPFLDSEGVQAYCDALETIQERYGNIKIMAITHDPTMKARFPQNLDVIKTDKGSKVIY
ncbi:MAG: AAA family ATPase [Lachnospiraceae bacterium]|nr:AAA family ATPase [Lachnospiraceae bacterium]